MVIRYCSFSISKEGKGGRWWGEMGGVIGKDRIIAEGLDGDAIT